jgi:hypothetical protein
VKGLRIILQRWTATASLTLLCISIALSPLPFGSVGLPTIVVWVAVLGFCAILVSVQPLDFRQAKLLVPIWIFSSCWIAVLYLQTSPPSGILSSFANPVWAETGDVLGVRVQPIPAALRFQSVISQGPALLAVLTLSCGIVLGSVDRYAKAILLTFAWSGLAYAVYGIVSFLIDPSTVFGMQKDAYQAELTATFYNRNTAAIYFGCCAMVWLLRTLQGIKTGSARSDPNGRKPFLRGAFSATLLLPWLATLVCVMAMFMTRSRAGSVVSICGLIVASLAFFSHSLPSRSSWLISTLGAVAGAGVFIQFLGGGTAERLAVDGLSDGGRLQGYRYTLQMIETAPWLGSGLGSFPWVFPTYRGSAISSWGVWDRAHNTLLELAAEVGVPMAALIAVGWVIMLILLARGIATRRKGVGCPAVALGILVAGTLHSMVDFPLQIPAFSVVFFAIVGVGLSQSLRPRSTSTGR